ncbi:nectin-1 isoform X2 [Amia ocellicauda]|uniref:nectin-1 isoform X2 n=1 Tax=Amia ocellicauda TaxID=2972642 RepID=UPI003463CEF9
MYTDWLLHWCNDSKDISRKITWNIFNLAFCSFLLFLPHQISGISVLNGGVTATVGEDTSLTCRLVDTEESISQISWQRKIGLSSEPENFLTFDPDTGPNAVGDFGKRVEFIGNVMRLDGSISIPNPLLSDEGTYICIFTVFPSGPYKHNIRLTVNAPPIVTVTTEDTPEVGCEERTLATCIAANGKPDADVSWEYGEDFMILFKVVTNSTVNANNTITIRSELRAIPTRSMQQKEVRCIVNHPSLTQAKNISQRLSVHYPPQLVNITNVENSPLGTIFICETEANPPPTDYHWHRINQTFPSSKIRVDGSRLELLEQSPDVNGMYVCEASTKFGKAFGSIYIHIDTTSSPGAIVMLIILLLVVGATGPTLFILHKKRWWPFSSNNRGQANYCGQGGRIPLPTTSPIGDPPESEEDEVGSPQSAGQMQEIQEGST